MIQYDDIINVNAFLRSRMRENATRSAELGERIESLGEKIDGQMEEADALLARTQRLAAELGLDISDIMAPDAPAPSQQKDDAAQLLVEIPANFDFGAAFERLREEAHAAGFTHTRPEELLTREEIEHARAFSEALDARFATEAGLTGRDMTVLAIAVTVRMLCRFAMQAISAASIQKNDAAPSETTAPTLDAAHGVDMGAVLRNGSKLSSLAAEGQELVGRMTGRQANTPVIRLENQIMNSPISFNVADNDSFLRRDILGYHPMVGWLVGVVNLLTNTVTTRRMESFSVIDIGAANGQVCVGQKLSTIAQVVIPVATQINGQWNSLLAAVIREGQALGIVHAPSEVINRLMKGTIESEMKAQKFFRAASAVSREGIDALEKVPGAGPAVKDVIRGIDMGSIFSGIGLNGFENRLITAIHAAFFDVDRDHDEQLYALRTNRIISISSGIVALASSLPALIARDVSKLDFSGIITAAVNLVNSQRFWIEAKANYLVSEYRVQIDRQMAALDPYFKVVSPD